MAVTSWEGLRVAATSGPGGGAKATPVFWPGFCAFVAFGDRLPNQVSEFKNRALSPTKRSRAPKMRIAMGIRVFMSGLRGSYWVFPPVPAQALPPQCKLSVNCASLAEICAVLPAVSICVPIQAGYGAGRLGLCWSLSRFLCATWHRSDSPACVRQRGLL